MPVSVQHGLLSQFELCPRTLPNVSNTRIHRTGSFEIRSFEWIPAHFWSSYCLRQVQVCKVIEAFPPLVQMGPLRWDMGLSEEVFGKAPGDPCGPQSQHIRKIKLSIVRFFCFRLEATSRLGTIALSEQ